MNRRHLLLGALLLWLAVFGILTQPHGRRISPVTHTHLLDPSNRNLPTLAPNGP